MSNKKDILSYSGSDHIRSLRKENGYTQQFIADLLGVDRKTYLKWENGEVPIPSDKAYILSKNYSCSIDYLFGLSQYRTIDAASVADITGLSDAAINTLEIRRIDYPVARTVSALLEDYEKNGADSVLNLIKNYLSAREGQKIETKAGSGFSAPLLPVSYKIDLSAALLLSLNASMDKFRREYWNQEPKEND